MTASLEANTTAESDLKAAQDNHDALMSEVKFLAEQICTETGIDVFVYGVSVVCTYVCTYVCTLCTYVDAYVCTYVCTYICMCVCAYVSTGIFVTPLILTYTHAHIHTYTQCPTLLFD